MSTLFKASVGNWVPPFSWGTQYLVIVIFLCWNIVDPLSCVTTILLSTPWSLSVPYPYKYWGFWSMWGFLILSSLVPYVLRVHMLLCLSGSLRLLQPSCLLIISLCIFYYCVCMSQFSMAVCLSLSCIWTCVAVSYLTKMSSQLPQRLWFDFKGH